ncbi:hypothetical protein TNCT_142961 [Trichonephila clavata]|uniref:J domain-containing protein n=1 Tax=Trichonephila clavata TaxID=2740835 RepID=A0A8X6F0L0_TRICU|nr:hypothetical protein TNCT_142961 [Trichonephila clavata]
MKLTRGSIRKLKFDDELRYIVEDSEDDIVERVAQHVINHKSLPNRWQNRGNTQQQTTSSSNQQPTQHVWPSEKDSDLQAGPSGSTEQSGAMEILSDLDESLAHVRGLGHSEEAIKEYDSSFKEIFTKQYRQLALKFHPDKQDEETRDAQEMNNLNMMNQIMEKLYEVSKKKDSFRYTLFSKVAFNFLHQNRDKCSSFINGNVAAELRNITIWRQRTKIIEK